MCSLIPRSTSPGPAGRFGTPTELTDRALANQQALATVQAMKAVTLSEQLRAQISDSGVSRYELAKQVGVAESVLSRFMSGGHGLTLATVDRLGAVLGLSLHVLVPAVQLPVRQAEAMRDLAATASTTRKRDRRKPMQSIETSTVYDWSAAATRCARQAHEKHFSSRRGLWNLGSIGGRRVFCYYNNNPYARQEVREEEHAELRRWLREAGHEELGSGCHPALDDEESPGYTTAILINGGPRVMQQVEKTLREILERSLQRLDLEVKP